MKAGKLEMSSRQRKRNLGKFDIEDIVTNIDRVYSLNLTKDSETREVLEGFVKDYIRDEVNSKPGNSFNPRGVPVNGENFGNRYSNELMDDESFFMMRVRILLDVHKKLN